MYLLLQFSFNRFEIIQGSSIGYRHSACAFFEDRINFEFLANFSGIFLALRPAYSTH